MQNKPRTEGQYICVLANVRILTLSSFLSDKMISAMNTAAIRSESVGRVVDGRFTLLRWLGGSETSGVFLTELEGNPPQNAAIKLIPADAVDVDAQVAAWTAAKTLPDPYLVHLFQTGHCQIDDVEMIYAVMEYAEEDLSQILPERPLTPTEASEMLVPLVDALSYLHGRGFVHGHIKPSNIMVVDNQLKLSADNLQVEGEPGKPPPMLTIYDAPERANEAISPDADIWSLGVTLVEALTQHPPIWDRSTTKDPLVPESVPQPFADIAQKCMRRDPARRCTLGEIKARLEPARTSPELHSKVSAFPEPSSRAIDTAPAKQYVTGIVVAALVLIVVIGALMLRSHKSQPSLPTEPSRPSSAITANEPQSPASGPQSSGGPSAKGAVVGRVLPNVPKNASETIQGTIKVRIRVAVDPSGNVSNATLDAPGPSKYFARLALQAAQQWKFTPPQVNGQAVPSVWILQFQFRRTATEVTPTEVSHLKRLP
jgi:TonB family protein